jgi:hypothetical protein
MVAWEVDGQVLTREDGAHLQIGVLLGVEEDPEIEVALPKPPHLLGGGEVSDVSLERRLGFVQSCEKTQQSLDREVDRTPDAELRSDGADLPCLGQGMVEGRARSALPLRRPGPRPSASRRDSCA